jgi:hypothetical protein
MAGLMSAGFPLGFCSQLHLMILGWRVLMRMLMSTATLKTTPLTEQWLYRS